MRLTNKQKKEIVCLDYFSLPIKQYSNKIIAITQHKDNICFTESNDGLSPEECYFLITDQGKKDIICTDLKRLNQLLDAKKWRLRTIDMYEQGILDGSVPYFILLGLETKKEKVSENIMNFIAKTMFQGIDFDLINNLYRQ
jgi:hypothetical protein